MGAERILGTILAWLATCAIHSTVLIAAAWALGAALARIAQDRASLAAARENLWKLAIFGGIATATLSAAGAGTWQVHIGVPARTPAKASEAPAEQLPLPAPASDVNFPARAKSLDMGNDLRRTAAAIGTHWIEIVAALWLLGVVIGATAWVRDARKLRRRLRARERIRAGPVWDRLADLRRRTSVASNAPPGTKTATIEVPLSRAPALPAPITLGILRPEICIPPRAETDLMPDELEAMLAHELAHARRRDPLLLALCRAVEVLFFFQPLVRFARARLLDEVEILCDERAAKWTGDPASLASCLAEVATWIVAGNSELGALSISEGGSRLALRVRSLLEDHAEDHPEEHPEDHTGNQAAYPSGSLRRNREGRSKGRRAWLSATATFVLASVPLAAPAVSMDADPEPRAPEADAPSIDALPVDALSLDPGGVGALDVSGDLGRGARELTTILDALESEWNEIASDPTLAQASTDLRERVAQIEARLQTLREMRARLETLIAEETPAERQHQP